ncbi:MAG: hypothetical protein N4A47_07610 [Clostridia bacterium]|jgi:hypothetical protein|nr:hypothetical protein [Clostridia bacterium]
MFKFNVEFLNTYIDELESNEKEKELLALAGKYFEEDREKIGFNYLSILLKELSNDPVKLDILSKIVIEIMEENTGNVSLRWMNMLVDNTKALPKDARFEVIAEYYRTIESKKTLVNRLKPTEVEELYSRFFEVKYRHMEEQEEEEFFSALDYKNKARIYKHLETKYKKNKERLSVFRNITMDTNQTDELRKAYAILKKDITPEEEIVFINNYYGTINSLMSGLKEIIAHKGYIPEVILEVAKNKLLESEREKKRNRDIDKEVISKFNDKIIKLYMKHDKEYSVECQKLVAEKDLMGCLTDKEKEEDPEKREDLVNELLESGETNKITKAYRILVKYGNVDTQKEIDIIKRFKHTPTGVLTSIRLIANNHGFIPKEVLDVAESRYTTCAGRTKSVKVSENELSFEFYRRVIKIKMDIKSTIKREGLETRLRNHFGEDENINKSYSVDELKEFIANDKTLDICEVEEVAKSNGLWKKRTPLIIESFKGKNVGECMANINFMNYASIDKVAAERRIMEALPSGYFTDMVDHLKVFKDRKKLIAMYREKCTQEMQDEMRTNLDNTENKNIEEVKEDLPNIKPEEPSIEK